MGNDISTLRTIACGAFGINVAAQFYGGAISSPNMKVVAEQNHYAFSPHPMAIGTFFLPQMVLQLAWLRSLYTGPVDQAQVQYIPIYALGNLCISGWMIFWCRREFGISQALVCVNSFAHLYAVSQLPDMTTQNRLTHWVAKTTAGIGLLDFLDNGATFLRYAGPPTMPVKLATGAFFAAACGISDFVLGTCVVFDAVALYSGHKGTAWGTTLGWFSVGSAVAVFLKALLKR